MIARVVTLMLVVMLTLPAVTLTRPAHSSQSSWANASVAAKGKKHKSHKHKRHKQHKQPQQNQQPPTTVRQTVTQTFTSAQPITIPNGAPNANKGKADPYPSTIDVSGFTNGTITDVNLILNDLTHMHHDDIDVLLSTENGRRALVMSDVGDASTVADIDLTLDDEAAAAMPGGQNNELSSGTFRPTNRDGFNADTFDSPAPPPDGNVALSTFDGANPNGAWQLWVMDNADGDHGDLGGWSLQITAEVDVQVEPAQTANAHHQKQRQDRRFSGRRRETALPPPSIGLA